MRTSPSNDRTALRATRLKEKIAKLKDEMQRLEGLEAQRQAAPDQQISLSDPDAPTATPIKNRRTFLYAQDPIRTLPAN